MDNSERSDCRGHRYCGRWRTCMRCARKRQALWATKAEQLERKHGRLIMARTTPEENSAAAIRAMRDKIVRAKLAPAGIWTIETGSRFCGLHLNLLAPADSYYQIKPYVDYVEEIRTTPRAAGAYIVDPDGFPALAQYSGRLAGTWGSFTQVLMESHAPDVAYAQAAILEYTMRTPEQKAMLTADQRKAWDDVIKEHPPKIEKTRDEYREIARRNLGQLYAAMAKR